MVRLIYFIFILNGMYLGAMAQSGSSYKIVFPADEDWKEVMEGEEISFQLTVHPRLDSVRYEMESPEGYGMKLDSTGLFSWQTHDGLVSDEDEEQFYYVLFKAYKEELLDSVYIEFVVINRQLPTAEATNVQQIVSETTTELDRIVLPQKPGWNLLHEGDTLSFKLKVTDMEGREVRSRFYLEEGEKSGISLDPDGNFFWIPGYDFVDRLQQTREKHVFFIAEDETGKSVSEKIVFTVFHKNQPPIIQDLAPFYVLLGTNNHYEISSNSVTDIDGDPIVYLVDRADLPEGMEFSSSGKISWSPSRQQFSGLRQSDFKIPFFAEDQPAKSRTRGFLSVESSARDMPPEITIFPSESHFTINENDRLQLAIHLSDANGDDDIEKFSFVTDDESITNDLLRKNTDNQYEFIWTPGYDFVKDPDPEKEVNLRFFALDRTRKTSEKVIKIKVLDTEDLSRKDADNYELYKELLVEMLNLMDHLEANQKDLEKDLKKAKKGKKNRAIMNATIGAITGLSPVIAQDDAQKTISVIGGTSTLTLGTLEAKEVIGKSVNEINEKIKVNSELYNQYLSEGISFARRYNSKSNRRNSNFTFDVEKIRKLLVNPKLTSLQLDAGWKNKKKLDDKRLKSIFTDFDVTE